MHALKPLLLVASLLATLGATMVQAGPITIGPGPARGTDRAGVTWYEDFQDWTHADLRALDGAGSSDVYGFGDGFDDSRDIVAFYSRAEGANVYFRVDLLDLAFGAEQSHLDLYLAIDAAAGGQSFLPDFLDCQTDQPWELCLAIYRSGTGQGTDYRLFDPAFNQVGGAYLGAYFNSQLDAVEFGLTRQSLISAGWNGTSPLRFQVFTTNNSAETSCDGGGASSDLTDAIVDDDRGCSDGFLNGGTLSTDGAGLVYYASIAHGNQSVNKAGDIGAHIYDPQSNTGISGGTGFLRALDTHRIFGVPLNVHPSGTLTIACNWAARPGGSSDPQDGPSFLAEIARFVDPDQSDRPGSLIGGVLAEHILPYYEGPVNAASLAATDSLNRSVYGVSAAESKVMHVPERVIRSQSTGLAPLDGHTFEDIAASPYLATYLDEITHLHWWFYAGENCSADAGYRHKVHKINGVYAFMINDREDQGKFGNHDGGMVMDTRLSLLQKAMFGGSSEIVVVFDDWEALGGKSFDPVQGISVPNDNPNQYHNTIRWAANHPWIRISNLRDVLDLALANPAAFVIDHGTRFDLSIQSYEWLKHASEDAYHYWYYNDNAGFGGNEQNFYDLVPVITGPQGDYHTRNATPAQDGPPLPNGMKHGDLNSPNTLMYETWKRIHDAPAGRLRDLGIYSYLAMIYETAWHEEDQTDYSNNDCYGPWLFPDQSWDGVNTWCLRLANHARQAGIYAAAAQWADSVRAGRYVNASFSVAADLDFDGENEFQLYNHRVFVVFERYGGRCVFAAAFDPITQDAQVVIGAPFTNPSAPGEEEYTGAGANRCSALKDMNDGIYADAPYDVVVSPNGWDFQSADDKIHKIVTLAPNSTTAGFSYQETLAGPLYLRIGLSPNPLDLAYHGQTHLSGTLDLPGGKYTLQNSAGGGAVVNLGNATWNSSPSFAGANRRNLALTEEVEISGEASIQFGIRFIGGVQDVAGVNPPGAPVSFAVRGPSPSPSRGEGATLWLTLPRAATARVAITDVSGRIVSSQELGRREAGVVQVHLAPRDAAGAALAPGLYFVRVEVGGQVSTRRWVVLE